MNPGHCMNRNKIIPKLMLLCQTILDNKGGNSAELQQGRVRWVRCGVGTGSSPEGGRHVLWTDSYALGKSQQKKSNRFYIQVRKFLLVAIPHMLCSQYHTRTSAWPTSHTKAVGLFLAQFNCHLPRTTRLAGPSALTTAPAGPPQGHVQPTSGDLQGADNPTPSSGDPRCSSQPQHRTSAGHERPLTARPAAWRDPRGAQLNEPP